MLNSYNTDKFMVSKLKSVGIHLNIALLILGPAERRLYYEVHSASCNSKPFETS